MRHPALSDALLDPRGFALTGVSSSRCAMNFQLLHVLRTVIRADSDPARQALFANLMQSRLWVRFAFRLHHRLRGTWGSTFVIACYGLISFFGIAPPRNRGARVLAVAQHENARRQIDRVSSWIGRADCGVVRTGLAALFGLAVLLPFTLLRGGGRLGSVLRTVRVIERRYGLMVSCRAIRVIAWYVRARMMLDEVRPGAILVSSDSNPEELGFVGAARALDIPHVFVSHAYPTPFSPPLDFSLSILEGKAAVHARLRKGPITGQVLLAGIEGESVPLDAARFCRRNPVVGIFTPKAVSWPALAAIIDDCRRHYAARQIVIRWHPSMLEPPQLVDWVRDRSGITVSSSTVPIGDVARLCDWVIADENSNVHLPVLKLGIPTIAVSHLGLYPASRSDLYGFVANGIVFPPVTTVRDVDPDALRGFFSESWSRRFERYDVSYMRPHGDIGREVRHAILALVEDSPSTSAAG